MPLISNIKRTLNEEIHHNKFQDVSLRNVLPYFNKSKNISYVCDFVLFL